MDKINIQFTKNSYQDYLKLPLQYKKLVDKVLSNFENGLPIDIKPIKGEVNTFRIRVGKYRILLIKLLPNILIVKIKKRDDIYK